MVARAFLEDPTGALGLDDVRGRDFTPFDGVLTRGFGTSAIWLRLRIDPKAPGVGGEGEGTGEDAGNLVLRIQPAFLDEIALYDPEAGASGPRLAGDRQERAEGEYTSANINFTVPRGTAPRDLYMRIETSSTRLVSVTAMPPLETLARDQRQQIVNAFYMALVIGSLIWATVEWMPSRDPLVGAFAFKQVWAALWAFFLLGYGPVVVGQVLPAVAIDRISSVVVIMLIATSVHFEAASSPT